jgi:hypothetical protein
MTKTVKNWSSDFAPDDGTELTRTTDIRSLYSSPGADLMSLHLSTQSYAIFLLFLILEFFAKFHPKFRDKNWR